MARPKKGEVSKAGFIKEYFKAKATANPDEIKAAGRRQYRMEITDNDINAVRRRLVKGASVGGKPTRSAARKHLKLLIERFGTETVVAKITAVGQNPVYQLIAGLGGTDKALTELKRLTEKKTPELNDETQQLFKAFA